MVLTDIEERKKAEEKLEEQQKEFRQILDLAPQMVAVFGPKGERLYANSVALAYIGATLEEWQRQRHGYELHPDDLERLKVAAERALSNRSAYELEVRIRKSDGTYRWFLARYNPMSVDHGHPSRWYVACTDIEDRKRAEERLQQENVALREEIDKTSMFEEIVGTSPALTAVLSLVSKVAASDSTVLITGETGTGKELVARAIHRRSGRSSKAFVAVNCAAIPRDLIASELFGHEKGAFTGALQRRLGRFELANGGTIFLDEVAELSPDTQAALLRVLQERELEHVGGTETIQRRRSRHRCHESRFGRCRRQRDFPRGPLLSTERLSARDALACGTGNKTFRCWWNTSSIVTPARRVRRSGASTKRLSIACCLIHGLETYASCKM